jgi:hypothetical protein
MWLRNKTMAQNLPFFARKRRDSSFNIHTSSVVSNFRDGLQAYSQKARSKTASKTQKTTRFGYTSFPSRHLLRRQ